MGRGLSVETVKPGELTPEEIGLWMAFIQADAGYASPYFHPAFTRVAGEVTPGAAVALIHQGGDIVGFFPHQRRGSRVQPIGAPLNDYHGVIARPGFAPVLQDLPALLGAASIAVNGWTGPGEGNKLVGRQTLQADLSQGWAAYDAERRDTWRKYFRDKDRARRSLERDHGALTVAFDGTDPASLTRLLTLKREQFNRSGRHDIFACGWTGDLLRALPQATEPGFGVRLAVLRAGGRPIAYEYGLYAGDQYHFWLPAYEAGTSRYSPGILLSLETMRLGAAEGFRLFDYGFEGEAYKKYACNREQTVLDGVVHAPGFANAIEAALAKVGAGPALTVGAALGQAPLSVSVRRRWAAIDACETTVTGRVRGVAAAVSTVVNRASAPRAGIGLLTLLNV
ncbi:COG5653 Protein involved in cellulose biosynthesis (CelD) [Caulobacteraceae bacterium]